MKKLSRSVLLMACLAMSSAHAENITVSAAASLKEAFGEIAVQYQKQYPDAKVQLNTAASGVLLQQILNGAPADVLATADEITMDKAVSAKAVDGATRMTFAKNSLVLITPKKSTVRVRTVNDLRQAGVTRIAIGKPESVPAGAYTKAALEKQNMFAALQSKWVYTQNVRQALDYVTRGEVEAGFVYRTDAQLQQDKLNIVAQVPTTTAVAYPVAVASASKQKAEATRFVQFLKTSAAQNILKKYGFSKP